MKKIFIRASLLIVPFIVISLMQGCSKKQESTQNEVAGIDILWNFKTGSSISSSPVKYENNIIVGSSDEKLYSIDLATQEENWSFKGNGPITNTPIVDGNIIIFSSYTTCYAVDGVTGEEIWKISVDGAPKESVRGYSYHAPSPLIYKDLVILPTSSGNIYGVNKTNGTKVWEYRGEESSDIIATPSIQDNIMCFADVKGKAYAMNLDTQETIWSKLHGEVVHSSLIYKDYVYFSGRSCSIGAYSLNDGSSKWSYTDKAASWITGDIIANDDKVYISTSDSHQIVSFDYDTGENQAMYFTKANVFSKPAISDGILYVTDGEVYNGDNGQILAYDINTKKKIMEGKFDKPIYSSPLVIDGVVYFGCADGNLYAVKANADK